MTISSVLVGALTADQRQISPAEGIEPATGAASPLQTGSWSAIDWEFGSLLRALLPEGQDAPADAGEHAESAETPATEVVVTPSAVVLPKALPVPFTLGFDRQIVPLDVAPAADAPVAEDTKQPVPMPEAKAADAAPTQTRPTVENPAPEVIRAVPRRTATVVPRIRPSAQPIQIRIESKPKNPEATTLDAEIVSTTPARIAEVVSISRPSSTPPAPPQIKAESNTLDAEVVSTPAPKAFAFVPPAPRSVVPPEIKVETQQKEPLVHAAPEKPVAPEAVTPAPQAANTTFVPTLLPTATPESRPESVEPQQKETQTVAAPEKAVVPEAAAPQPAKTSFAPTLPPAAQPKSRPESGETTEKPATPEVVIPASQAAKTDFTATVSPTAAPTSRSETPLSPTTSATPDTSLPPAVTTDTKPEASKRSSGPMPRITPKAPEARTVLTRPVEVPVEPDLLEKEVNLEAPPVPIAKTATPEPVITAPQQQNEKLTEAPAEGIVTAQAAEKPNVSVKLERPAPPPNRETEPDNEQVAPAPIAVSAPTESKHETAAPAPVLQSTVVAPRTPDSKKESGDQPELRATGPAIQERKPAIETPDAPTAPRSQRTMEAVEPLVADLKAKPDQPAATDTEVAFSGRLIPRKAAEDAAPQSEQIRPVERMKQSAPEMREAPTEQPVRALTEHRVETRVDSNLTTPTIHRDPAPAAAYRAPQPFSTPRPANTEFVPQQPASPESSGPVREISVRFNDPAQDSAHLRVVDKGGEVLVSVRSGSEQFARTLSSDLGDLARRLEQSGFHAELSRPVAHSSQSEAGHERRDSSSTGDQNGSQSWSRDRKDSQQHPGQKSREWIEDLEESMGLS